jgi:hypothetical protein
MLSHLAGRRWLGVALSHGEAVGVERPPAGAGDPSGTEAEPSADVRSLQAYLRAGREPAIELQVAFGMQLACGDARYVAAGQADGPGVGLLQVDRLVGRAAVQQQRARQPGRPRRSLSRTGDGPGRAGTGTGLRRAVAQWLESYSRTSGSGSAPVARAMARMCPRA